MDGVDDEIVVSYDDDGDGDDNYPYEEPPNPTSTAWGLVGLFSLKLVLRNASFLIVMNQSKC